MVSNLSGKTIKGYELQKLIGTGGFGAVYKAYQALVKREVAVKVILPEFVNHPEFVRRFEAEAQLVAHLEHLHIVPLYDYWRDQTGAYLVMRWLRGGSLRSSLEKGHWPLNDAPRLVDQIASALATAHRNGVIHRDLKPDNILLDEERNAYLADFGIAKDLENITDFAALLALEEEQGDFVGSPSYLSPEQIKTEPVSAQSDIYSMGILLYEILTGRTPFHGMPVSTLIFKHLQDPLPHLHEIRPDLPEELNHVISKATEKDPSDRYPNVLALAADFKRAIAVSGEAMAELGLGTLDSNELSRLGITEEFISADLDDLVEPENPYKGLRAFQEADSDDFYGREDLIDRLLERMHSNGKTAQFLSVVGPSGSGKSSVVKAGLLPRLRRGMVPGSSEWFIVEMVPGLHPMEELEAALLRVAINPPSSLLEQLNQDERGLVRAVKRILPGSTVSDTELVVLIDQFEEVFTQVVDERERVHFLNSLLAAANEPDGRLRLIITLRADFYDRPLLYPGFGELVRESTELVLPLSREDLEKVIIEPAENAGLKLETGLVSSIVSDVSDQPSALPLLQYALTELFERREGRWLTVESYREIEGVSGALARRATELYEGLDTAAKYAARQVFLRLVSIGEGTEDTRRRVLLSELLSLQTEQETVQYIVDLFGKYRLLTFDRDPVTRSPTVEVAHEALIRQWSLLRQWLEDNRESLRLQKRLAIATEEWVNSGKDASFLATGTRLDQFEGWMHETDLAFTDLEREYLDASIMERERQEAEEAARKAKEAALERRSRNFLRALAAVLTIATVGALALSFFAFNQRQIAEENAVTATIAQGEAVLQADNAATAAAEARNLAFVSSAQLALAVDNTDLAVLLALEANASDSQSTVQSIRTLAEAAYAPGTRRVLTGHNDRVFAVAYSPDGLSAISGGFDNRVILWDVSTGGIIQTMTGHDGWVWDVKFSPDGRTAVSASQDKTLILWDLETGSEIRRFEGHEDVVRSVAFNVDGSQIISGSQDKSLILWDTATGEILQRFATNSEVYTVAFSRSGFTVLSGSRDGNIILWNVQSAQPLLTFGPDNGGHSEEVWGVVYTPDELGMLSGSEDSTILLWSFETGRPVRRFEGHSSRVTSVAFNPDGGQIVSGSEDNTVIVWDVATGAVLHRFIGHTFLVYGVAFSPDALHVMSASWDGTIRLWDIENGAQLRVFGQGNSTHTDDVTGVAFAPDGSLAASASFDGSIMLWDVATGALLRQFRGHEGPVNCVEFSPDGHFIVSGSDDETLILWDVESGEILKRFEGHSGAIWAAAFGPDGNLIASGSRDNTLILWNIATGEQIHRLFGHTFRVTGVDFSPDGTQLISTGFDNILILWNVATGEQIRKFEGHQDWVRGVKFSPDGRSILSSAADNDLILWDVASGQRLRNFEGHSAQVYTVDFSPDGRYALSGSADRSMILWDIETGAELQRFTGHADDIRSVAFSPDGARAVTGSGDRSVRLWQIRLTVDALKDWINDNRYVRELTCVERGQYDIEPLCPTPTPVIVPGQSL